MIELPSDLVRVRDVLLLQSVSGPEAGQVAATVLGLRCRLEAAGGQIAWFATPEGTIIGELYSHWFGSDRPMRSFANILRIQAAAGKELDPEMIGGWARGFDPGLHQAWLEKLDAVGLGS